MTTKSLPGGVCAPQGFKAAGLHVGFRQNTEKPDLALILSDVNCAAAAVYTLNKVQGAPLGVTRQNIADGHARGILCNSSNANTCAPGGVQLAQNCCKLLADATALAPEDFVVASTGVIGQVLPIEPFERGIPPLVSALSADGCRDAAAAIMTTDTVMKEIALEFTLGGVPCRMGAIGKGSGMINPNMATMLIFITTDVAIAPALLQKALGDEVQLSFNQITVDGDTSTNDMVAVLASGLSGNAEITAPGADYDAFCAVLSEVCVWMSRAIAADGEGATKLLECVVTGAPSDTLARLIAKTVVGSDLFKAAMFGADANWGRALCAIGYTPGDFPVDHISVTLKSAAGQVQVCKESVHHPYSEDDAARILAEKEIGVLIDMGEGAGQGTAWGCDLTYDYVKINGDYRS
ncbi:MAG: bifunctional glutamate N-acetyltransferase/amino-acid acetyltransferase ArgJ [Ruminococcaceae bacterium]|nr:bifunctional glutamate N-acetyltransferase/amino-acid acetyltransferase ArgJ [Oscillospiraceae bacterium]